MSHNAIAQQMDEWKLLPRHQGFTELYFTSPREPIAHRADMVRHVDFTVRNSENRSTTYRYKLAVSAHKGADQIVGEGSITVPHGKSQRVQRDITIPQEGRVAVDVTVDYQGVRFGHDKPTPQSQLISYWITAARLPDNEDTP